MTDESRKAMTSDRIREIQNQTRYPQSVSVMQALNQVWNEVAQERNAEIAALKARVEELGRQMEAWAAETGVPVAMPWLMERLKTKLLKAEGSDE